ncbi:MAG: guanylate kinase [Clostridia bacterium]|nr:guanylate kinase [Clostridia bacterium]
MIEKRRGMLLVVSGPSGVGKGTVSKCLAEERDMIYSVSCTTRSPRPGEVDGREYRFVTEKEFLDMAEHDGFLEYASVHGHYYGTPRAPVEEAIEKGLSIRLEIDCQGALQVMEKMPGCVSVFILPPSYGELRRRLEGRGTETPEEVERRLRNARDEIAAMDHYQYLVVNDDLETARERLMDIVNAEKQRSCRYSPVIEEE